MLSMSNNTSKYGGKPIKKLQAKTFKFKIPGLNFELICTNLRTLTLGEIQFFGATVYAVLSFAFLYAFYPMTIILAYCYPSIIPVQVAYLLWLLWDRKTPFTGGRKWRSSFFRNAKVFKAGRDYFPLRLIKTAELPNDKNYLFVLFPHGTIPITPSLNFLTNGNNIDSVYPGIDFHFVAFNTSLRIPFLREMYLALGGCSCSESSIKYLLNQPPSKGVLILAGGAAEINLTKPGNEYQILKTRRKGFIRVALQTGAPLVPVFTFGENRAFIAHKVLNTTFFKRYLGIDLFVINGRGIFQHHFGMLPRNVPITSIVGKPIPVPKVEHPTQELINEYHERFFDDLRQLFEKYKHQYDNVDVPEDHLVTKKRLATQETINGVK